MSLGKTLVLVVLTLASCSPTTSTSNERASGAGGGNAGAAGGSGGSTAGAGGGVSAGSGAGPAAGSGGGGDRGGAAGMSAGEDPPSPTAGAGSGAGGAGGASVGADAGAPGGASGGTPADAAPASLPPYPLASIQAAKAELYASRGGHVEGVSWRDGELFFSVIPGGLFRVDRDRKVSRYLELPSNGTFLLGNGSLLVCDDRNGIVQVFPDGKVGVVGSGGRCNDVTVDRWGNIYFSDFGNSITRITPQGQQSKPLTGLRQPNGLEVDPESKFLYFMPRPSDIYRVAIDENGPTGQPEKLGSLDGVTDGCAFDAYGNLWVTVYYGGKIGVFDPTKRELLTYVAAGGRGLTNMTFGGPDRSTVFTTVDGKGIYSVPVGVRGFPGHPGAAEYPIKRYLGMAGAP